MARIQSLTALLALVSLASAQWDSCPLGKVNDTYPGDCANYIDTNNDDVCDRSQTAPAAAIDGPALGDPPAQQKGASLWGEYNLLPLSISIIGLYCLTFVLSRMGKISVLSHRRMWNVVLLMAFIVCGITGILLAVRLDLRWDVPAPALMSFWHVETGIAMTIVSVFHVLWHWKYFANVVSPGRSKPG